MKYTVEWCLTYSRSCHHRLTLEPVSTRAKDSCTWLALPPPASRPRRPVTVPVLWVRLFWTLHVNEILQYWACSVCRLLLVYEVHVLILLFCRQHLDTLRLICPSACVRYLVRVGIFTSLGCACQNGIAGSRGSFVFSVWKSLQKVSQNSLTVSTSAVCEGSNALPYAPALAAVFLSWQCCEGEASDEAGEEDQAFSCNRAVRRPHNFRRPRESHLGSWVGFCFVLFF